MINFLEINFSYPVLGTKICIPLNQDEFKKSITGNIEVDLPAQKLIVRRHI